jgi:hypothetical protein
MLSRSNFRNSRNFRNPHTECHFNQILYYTTKNLVLFPSRGFSPPRCGNCANCGNSVGLPDITTRRRIGRRDLSESSANARRLVVECVSVVSDR